MRHSRRGIAAVLAIIAMILLVVIEALLRFFNKNVFVIVALYGDSYCQAAKKAKALLHTNAFSLVMQHNVVTSIISAVFLVAAATCGVGAYLLSAHVLFTGDDQFTHVVLTTAVCTGVGGFVVASAFTIADAGATTLLIAFLLAPHQLRATDPTRFEQYRLAMPEAVPALAASSNV
mmetsp:Transcript_45617/g.111783  ORF Transcript_45617/g.111783 Transcript_45617/m.111783 type:complete len:176 (-) Transcript_45617:101-628(-)